MNKMEIKPIKSTSYQDLEIWKLSVDFVEDVYRLTAKFPKSETYGLTSQIRKAAVSIPSNIGEGQGRSSAREFRQFLHIALGSVAEIETHLIISRRINYLSEQELNRLSLIIDRMRKMIKGLTKSIGT